MDRAIGFLISYICIQYDKTSYRNKLIVIVTLKFDLHALLKILDYNFWTKVEFSYSWNKIFYTMSL